MKKGRIKTKKCLAAGLIASMLLLSGCGGESMDALVEARNIIHNDVEWSTVDVMRGSITPVFESNIELVGYNEVSYRMDSIQIDKITEQYGAEFDKLHVDVGDVVKAGDTLISFSSKDLDKKLSEGEKKKKEALLQIEHYQKLMAIDSTLDFNTEITTLNNEIRVANLHIEEVRSTYNSLNIVAEEDGVVSFVDEVVKNGFLLVGAPMVKVISFGDYYVMDVNQENDPNMKEDTSLSVSAKEIDFKIGNQHNAKKVLSEYKVEVIPDPTSAKADSSDEADSSDAASPSDAVSGNKIYFKLVDEESQIPDRVLKLYIEMKEIKDAIYVDSKALTSYENERYVYKVMEDGSFRAVKVTVGNSVGQYVVIKEGLSEGDKVAIQE